MGLPWVSSKMYANPKRCALRIGSSAKASSAIRRWRLWAASAASGHQTRLWPRPAWRHRKLEGGGGGAIDIGVHAMHLVRYVMGPIFSVQAAVRTFEPVRHHRDAQGNITQTVDADVDDTYFATDQFYEWRDRAVTLVLGWAWRSVEYSRAPLRSMAATARSVGQRSCSMTAPTRRRLNSSTPRRRRHQSGFYPQGFTDPYAIQQYDRRQAMEQGSQPETTVVLVWKIWPRLCDHRIVPLGPCRDD